MSSKSKDYRTLLEKLIDRAADPSTTKEERRIANEHIRNIKADIQAKKAEMMKDEAFASQHGFTLRPSYDPQRPNAGWMARNRHESDDGPPRKRDYKSPPRYQRGVAREAWSNLQAEARARAMYEEKLFQIFGVDIDPSKNRERIEKEDNIKRFIGVPVINNISLKNEPTLKRLLFWTAGNSIRMYWFIIERETTTGRTKRSKRYFSREGALLAHSNEQITWQLTEYT